MRPYPPRAASSQVHRRKVEEMGGLQLRLHPVLPTQSSDLTLQASGGTGFEPLLRAGHGSFGIGTDSAGPEDAAISRLCYPPNF